MANYTKGEWKLTITEQGWDIVGEHHRIAYYGSTQNPDYVANAHLIAAAPRMAKLLEYLVDEGWNAGVTEEAKEILAIVKGGG